MRSVLKSAAFLARVSVLVALPVASLLADAAATELSPSAAAQASSPASVSPAAAPALVSGTADAATAAVSPADLSSSAAAPAALPADVSATSGAAPEADSGTASDSSAAEPAAPLPDIQDNGQATQASETQDSSVQSDDESPFKWSNFILGFVGGALLGGTYGLLAAPPNNARIRNEDIGLYGGAAALAFGTVAIFLGGTTPQPAKPPEAGIRRPLPELVLALRF